ncbi:DUF3784 domain-containing protein [Neobacillus sedimentimangrovi]|jgi:hypothetical protein|uniref:DUF3784 domain-containing protein n=1 Tax=Neobacillus sedimentimangrovi TaxID=2699460 RepID=A0ABS8QJ48_9BACI|nr:DUF3784 domain-containing protein [Neobacillus sedimentimangrovi]AIM15142.1 hypothetical protein HW35_01540 [Bacillus sp. X1(2014)]MCD4839045.1 DUF3784 domain-containing protein [Neobacillus sedimentimangrovi]
MKNLDDFVQNYLDNFSNQLKEMSKVKRDGYVEEIKDHLYSFVQDKREQGYTQNEIIQKLEEDFNSPEKLANEILFANNKRFSRKVKSSLILAFTLIILSLPIFVPKLGVLPLSILFFVYSFIVFTKKNISGFFVIKKNNFRIKDRNKVAKIGGIYLFIIGLVLWLDHFFASTNLFIIVIVLFLVFSFFIQKTIIEK